MRIFQEDVKIEGNLIVNGETTITNTKVNETVICTEINKTTAEIINSMQQQIDILKKELEIIGMDLQGVKYDMDSIL